MYYKLGFKNVIKMKMKCTNLMIFLAGYFAVVAFGKYYKLKIPCLYLKSNKLQ